MPRASRVAMIARGSLARGSSGMIEAETRRVGTWRSLVAHSAGGRVVAGSNPAVPTLRGGVSLTERPGSFGHTPTRAQHHRVLRPDRGLLLRRVRLAGLFVGTPRWRCLRREDPPELK